MRLAEGRPYEDETAGRLIEAGFDLLHEGGWPGFSLRAAAEAIGLAGSAASHRFGDRAGLVAALCAAAIEREAVQIDAFLPDFRAEHDEELAVALYQWLVQRARENRRQTRTCAELLLASRRDPAMSQFGRQWRALVRGLIGRLAPGLAPAASAQLAAFLAAELPFWLLLVEDAEFRVISQEAVSRAVALASGSPAPLPTIWLLRGLAAQDPRRPMQAAGTKRRIIEAAAQVLVDGGVQALTHREVAKRSNASLSSLTYHFASLDDLIRQGFQWLFAVGRAAAPDGPLVRCELALQAQRDPALAPLASIVRRRLALDAFGPDGEDDPQRLARREADALLETGFALLGDRLD